MRHNNFLILIVIVCFSCSLQDEEKEWSMVKGSGSLKKYQEFLINYPHTSHLPETLDSIRSLWDNDSEFLSKDCLFNCVPLLIQSDLSIQLQGHEIPKDSIVHKVGFMLLNPNNDLDLPEKKVVFIDNYGYFGIPVGAIEIISDSDISTSYYSEIIELVKNSFLAERQAMSIMIYKQKYSDLESRNKSKLDSLLPINIRFERPGAFSPKEPPRSPTTL
jgi:hypothetical protein